MWDYYGYKPGKKPKDPAAQLAKLRRKNPDIKPVIIKGRGLAKTWWGMAWNRNLESYADYENRIGRGRSYVRSGAVLDLSVTRGEARGLVQGSRAKPYDITIAIDPLPQKKWEALLKKCSHKINDIEELASGRFPKELMELFTDKGGGLFPSPREIRFNCSCPDWAQMCKHVAAILYGIGARFDEDPMLFFTLRDIDFTELLRKSVDAKMKSMLKNAGSTTKRVMSGVDTKELFGV